MKTHISIGDQTIDLRGGTLEYWGFVVDPDTPLAEQTENLTEDLIQIGYRDSQLLLDVGWYPEMSPDGAFKVYLVTDHDWESPLQTWCVSGLADLVAAIRAAVDAAVATAA